MIAFDTFQASFMPLVLTNLTQFYTQYAGLHDEILPEGTDEYQNPFGRKYDLGREGAFGQFSILIGLFCSQEMKLNEFQKYTVKALEDKGFIVILTTEEAEFISKLPTVDSAWVVSGSKISETNKKELADAAETFHLSGRGLAIWADNKPWYAHANAILERICKNVTLTETTPGGKNLQLATNDLFKGSFARHQLTSGISHLYEGVTICYPTRENLLQTLALSTDGKPCMMYLDPVGPSPFNPKTGSVAGRIVVDCGITKLFERYWSTAGTDRYVRNVGVWLLAIDHRLKHGYPIQGPIIIEHHRDNCVGCHQPLSGQLSQIGENKWHKGCLKCIKCNHFITENVFSTFQEFPYCATCPPNIQN